MFSNRKRVLILGGTGFLGPATVMALLARGHHVTLFHRGRTNPGLFPNAETLLGDRDPGKGEGLNALRNRKFDAVIDNSGYFPRMVAASAKLLAPNAAQYIFISSISAYADMSIEGQDETAKLATISDPTVEDITDQTFGPLKGLCERAATDAFGSRATIVRPGHLVGPGDPSGRFTYWPVRMARGGEVLAPGGRSDPVQILDVRDLGAWLVLLIEQGARGTYNAVGPGDRLAWGHLLEACCWVAGGAASLVWAPGEWIRREAEDMFPIWAPYLGETRGFHTFSNARAVQAGLAFRPYADTAADTLEWYRRQPEGGARKLAGPAESHEAEMLAQWKGARC